MSANGDDIDDDDPTGLEDEPVDCYTHYYVVELPNPDDPNGPPVVYDGEFTTDNPLSSAELERQVNFRVVSMLARFSASPRFRERFGTQPQPQIIATGTVHQC